jgi:DNA polymerase-4
MAKKITQNLFFVKPRFEIFEEISVKIHKIFRYTDLVEPLSGQRPYLDVLKIKGIPVLVYWLKKSGRGSLMSGIDASAISINKFVAASQRLQKINPM